MFTNNSYIRQISNKDTLGNNISSSIENNINLYDLISNLDKPLKGININKNNISKSNIGVSALPFTFRFLDEMSNDKFIELFIEGINFIKNNWILNDLIIIKRLFFQLEQFNQINPEKLFFSFLYDKDENKVDIVYKKDFILSLFLQPPLFNNTNKSMDINEQYNIYFKTKLKEISLYLNFKNENIIEFNESFQMKLNKMDISYNALANLYLIKNILLKQ